MIVANSFAGRNIAVFGMARSGLAAARSLISGGARVACWDDGAGGRAAAEAAGLPLIDLHRADWSQFSVLVLSPGVPLTHPVPHWTVARAGAAGVPVIGDTELFFRSLAIAPAPRPQVVAITGTNGKSTTTALTAHLFQQLGFRTAMGGNIGEAVLGLAPFANTDVYVLELSSFQIDLTPSLAADAGILLNISPDHLDRHGTIEHYASVKARLVTNARAALIGLDDPWSRAIATQRLASGRPLLGLHIEEDATRSPNAVRPADLEPFQRAGALLRYTPADAVRLSTLVLRGPHNLQNIAASTRAVLALEGPETPELMSRLDAALRSFPGLAHRMQLIGRQGATLFVNDSKATNADAAAKALASYTDIYWIAGGKPKEGGIEPLSPFFPRIRRAYLIGEAAPAFAATLAGRVTAVTAGTLDAAVAAAARDAAADGAVEPVVLLSPACASFDQFADFEKRGEAFANFVRGLPRFAPPGQ